MDVTNRGAVGAAIQSLGMATAPALPAELSAEHYLVGSILLEGARIADVADIARPEHIGDPGLRRLYAAALKIHYGGAVPDVPSIIRTAGADDDLADLAADLRSSIGSAANIVSYAKQVREYGVRRECARIMAQGAEQARADRAPLESLVEHVRGELGAMLQHGLLDDASPFITAADFMARPASRYLIPDVIPDAGLGFLIGPPASAKSFLALELALSIACGRPLLHREGLAPTRAGWVAVLLGESLASWSARLRAGCDYHQIEAPDNLVLCDRPPALGDPVAFGAFARKLDRESTRRGSRPVLVIVDTLAACSPGVDENSAAEVGVVVAHLQQLVAGGSAVLVLHHPGKSSTVYRGSSALLGSADYLLRLEVEGRARTLVAEKLRDAEAIADVAFELVPHLGSAVVRSHEAPTATWQFSTADPDLRAAMQAHGYRLPGDPYREGALQSGGLSLGELQATWGKLAPIVPTRKESASQHQRVRSCRQTKIISLVLKLVDAGSLRVTEGKVSGADNAARSKSMQAIVRQVPHDA